MTARRHYHFILSVSLLPPCFPFYSHHTTRMSFEKVSYVSDTLLHSKPSKDSPCGVRAGLYNGLQALTTWPPIPSLSSLLPFPLQWPPGGSSNFPVMLPLCTWRSLSAWNFLPQDIHPACLSISFKSLFKCHRLSQAHSCHPTEHCGYIYTRTPTHSALFFSRALSNTL